MASITTRAGKGSPLTHAEVDANFNNLNNGKLDISTAPAGSITVDSSGRLLVGTSTNGGVYSGINPQIQLEGTSYDASTLSVYCNNNTQLTAPVIIAGKSRGAANGAVTIVQNGDRLGALIFTGADGTNRGIPSSSIEGYVDGTPGTSDMPGRLVFSTTADGASSPTERMRISSNGAISINSTNTNYAFQVGGVNCAHFGDAYDTGNYGVVQLSRPANQNDDRHHLSFVRSGFQVAGLGFLRNSSTFAVMNASGTNGSGVTLTVNATSWGTTSDERKKRIIGDVNEGLNKISAWRCIYFSYLNESEDVRRVGLIAQDVQATLPEAVSVEEDELGTLQLRYTEILPVLVKALQESKERIEQLEAKVAALEASS